MFFAGDLTNPVWEPEAAGHADRFLSSPEAVPTI
jgi:hypothetical protein